MVYRLRINVTRLVDDKEPEDSYASMLHQDLMNWSEEL